MIIALQILILVRESVLALLNEWLPPFVTQLVKKLSDNGLVPVKEDIEEQVFALADYDDECGVVFFPPVYAQRYAAVCDCLMDERWFGRLEKVLNIGKHYDTNFMRYLTEVSGVTQILGLDITCSLNCTCDVLDLSLNDYKRWEKPLQITLLQGNAADPDYRLIGCDAVIAIETIQKLLPHDLDRLVHNVFGFVKPWVALFTTPNADFNCLLKNLDNNGLRQSDHYFEWTREQLHDWCSNIVRRYPEYMVMSRGVGPGPAGTSHYGCFSQLVLFISKHYKKEMELSVNSLVMISNLPEPEQASEISCIANMSPPRSHSAFNSLESESSEPRSYQSFESTEFTCLEYIEVQAIDKSVQCDLDVEFGKKFVMFDDDEMYQIKMPRKRFDENVYEIGDVARRLNNTTYQVKHFSKTTQYLMEQKEINSKDLMDEILQLTEKLTCKINLSSGDESHIWNNVNWGENVPYWNQYYKVVGVYNFPYEDKCEDDAILELLSEETNKLFDKHSQGSCFGIPVEMLMDSVKHITDDVERVIMLMEDSGYEMEGESVVYTGIDVSEASHNEEFESNFESDSLSNGSSSGGDFNGRLLNRTLGRKIKTLRLMLPQEEDIKQALARVICRLKKIAISSGPGKQGPARSKWLQSKLLELLTMTEKSILRKKMRNIEVDQLKDLFYYHEDEIASHLSRIKAEDDIALKIVEKYGILQMTTDNTDDLSHEHGSDKSFPSFKFTKGSDNSSSVDVSKLNEYKEICEMAVPETDDLSSSPNEVLARYTLGEQHVESVQDWDEKDVSLYEEETHETKIRTFGGIISPKQSKHMKSPKESTVKTTFRSTKRKITNNSNSRIPKKKSKHSATFITVKRSLKNTSSYEVIVRKNDNARNSPEIVINKLTYDNTFDCIDIVRKKLGPTLVLSVPPKPIPGSILELCHPELHQKTADPFPKTNNSWVGATDPPVAATEISQKVEILSQSATTTVALQRMIGTDPDVDAEIYEHDLELSDLTSLMNETSYFARTEETPREMYDLSRIVPSTEESSAAMNPVVEIVTQDGREFITLQRSIGTDPEVDTEVCEQELVHSKLTTSLSKMVSFQKIPAGLGNVTSQEFFLYDLNEPTTSKGIRLASMDVQCGTEGQISATTSFTCPLKKFQSTLQLQHSNHVGRAVLKNDCVTSTHAILKPCASVASPWMKSLGIKIKDSNYQIKDTSDETGTDFIPSETSTNTIPKNSVVSENFHSHRLVRDTLDQTKNKIPNLIAKNTKSPILYGRPNLNEIRTKESNRASIRFMHVPKVVRSKLSCGGIHVHSYKELQVSEDVVYQGKWQRYRRSYNSKKPKQSSTDKLKFTLKKSAPPKPQKPIIQKAIASPIIIRNTKANKMKGALMKSHRQNKLATKLEVPRNRTNWQMTKNITYKSTFDSYSKPIKEKSTKFMQPPRYTRPAPKPPAIKDIKIPTTQKRKVYIPPYLEKMTKKQQVPNTSNQIKAKTDIIHSSLSNILNVKNGQLPSKLSQSKVDDLLSAFLKVSVEPPKDISYIVCRNKMETSNCSTAIENIPATARPSSKENILRRKLSQLGNDKSAYASANSAGNTIQSKRQTTLIKSSIKRKGSDSQMVSRIKKLTNIMFSKKTHKNLAKVENAPENSAIFQNNAKNPLNVDSLLDGTANSSASSKESSKSSIIKSSIESSINNGSYLNVKSKEYCGQQDSDTNLILNGSKSNIHDLRTNSVFDCSEGKSDIHESVNTQILVTSSNKGSLRVLNNEVLSNSTDRTNETKINDTSSIYHAMKEFVEQCLNFEDTSKLTLNDKSENAVLNLSDSGKITSIGSETYETSSSFHRTYDGRSLLSLASLTQSFVDCSQASVTKISESLEDETWYPIVTPSHRGSEVHSGNKDTISITQKPKAGPAFSSFSVTTQPSPLELTQQPDYVNLVNSETGSCARTSRRATSEEILVSGRSSESYVSCVLDEDAAVPSWMYNVSQQASGSFSSSRHAVLPEAVPELEYDVNGNELTAQGAGAGDGCGIHSDISQDSSGHGSSFSSNESSRVHSESIADDPGSFLQGFAPAVEHPSSSSAAPAEESIETLDISVPENQNRPVNRSRIPRTAHRISLPASDADISSLDTDVASD